MNRRRYLIAATAVLSSVAGCSERSESSDGEQPDENDDPSTTTSPATTTSPVTTTPPATTTPPNSAETPKAAVRSYLNAVFAGEVQAVNQLIHPDGNAEAYSEEAAERMETLDLTIQSLEVTEENENTATVNAVVTIESTESGTEQTRSQNYILQTDDGTWKIYDADDDESA